jgi:hypothetical protein
MVGSPDSFSREGYAEVKRSNAHGDLRPWKKFNGVKV